MANFTSLVLGTSALALLAAACETPVSTTGLNPEGPPMITQVFLKERQITDPATGAYRDVRILAFGTHPGVLPELQKSTDASIVVGQQFRVVVDELLIGNYLEEVACRSRNGCVVDGGYSRVPEGATPDDIANCIVSDDLLVSTCTGEHAVCLDGAGVPCGVLDDNPKDSAIDSLRFIQGQVKLICENPTATPPTRFEIDMEQTASYWQPSGNQFAPPGTDPSGLLGPALVLKPVSNTMPARPVLPTSQTCRLWFASDVTDKEHLPLCTPPEGDMNQACAAAGDVSGFTFKTIGLTTTGSVPRPNTMGAPRGNPILFFFNTTIDDLRSKTLTVMAGASVVPASAYTVTIATDTNHSSGLTITMTAPLAAATQYTVTLTGLADLYGVPPAAPVTLTFTTAPAAAN